MSKLKKITTLFACIVMLCAAVGCTKAEEVKDTIAETSGNFADRASKLLKADGREYDKLLTAGMNETLTCNFFDFSITAAELADTLADYEPQQEGFKFLVADVTVKNVFEEPIPVGNYDFYIIWAGGSDYAYESFFDEMYPDDVNLADGETLSGKLVFEIPADATDIMIVYEEIYEDEFIGNNYMIGIDL